MIDHRDPNQRTRVLEQVVSALRSLDVVSLHDLARAAGDIPEHVVARIVKRFAVRGLVRNVSQGRWTATAAMRVDPHLIPQPA